MNSEIFNLEQSEILQIPTLQDTLVSATFAQNRAIKPGIKKIDLGSLKAEADLIRSETLADPQRRERSKLITVSSQGTIDLPQEITLGESSYVGGEFRARFLVPKDEYPKTPKQFRQDKFLGFIMHSHGVYDVPPSGTDIEDLLYEDTNFAAATSVFVITNSLNYLIFRGKNTPQLPEIEVNEIVDTWYEKYLKEREELIRPSMSLDEQFAIRSILMATLNRQIAQEYDLQTYTGLAHSQYVSLQTA